MGVIVWQQSRIVVTYQLKFVVQKITNIIINMKASLTLVLSVIAAVAVADHPVAPYQPAPYHAPAPAPYHAPAPAPYHAPEPAPYHESAPYHAPAPAPYHAPVPHPAPAPYHAPKPAPYHAPVHHKPAPYHPEPYHAHPFNYGYEVHDVDAYGNPNVHSKHEESDGKVVKGQYTVVQDDCRTRIVDYFVDEYKQFHADVKYEGEICPGYYEGLKAKHGKHPHGPAPYHAPKPAPYHAPVPHPAPAPYHAPAPAPYHAPAPAPAYAPAPYHA